MRGNWAIFVISLIGLSAVLGCKSEPKLKPPSHPEELIIPSMADARFSTPDYPKAAFKTNNDIKKESDELPGAFLQLEAMPCQCGTRAVS